MTAAARPARLDLGPPARSGDERLERCEVPVVVPADLVWFDGHFDSGPVLPAVILLQAVLQAIAAAWPDLPPLRRVVKAKFMSPVTPSAELRFVLERSRLERRVRFRVERGHAGVAAGTLEFDDAERPRS